MGGNNVSLNFLQIRLFSFNVILSLFLIFLFVRNGGIEFQKILLVNDWFSVDFEKYCFTSAFVRLALFFFVCVRPTKFSLDGHLLHLRCCHNCFAQFFSYKMSLISPHLFLFYWIWLSKV